jgi:hypothetical protein
MGFEDDDISAAELAAMFKNTDNSDKLDTGNVVLLFDVDCTDPGFDVLSNVKFVRRQEI